MKLSLSIVALVFAFAVFNVSAYAQGALGPDAGPAPTMKTLAQIEPRDSALRHIATAAMRIFSFNRSREKVKSVGAERLPPP